MRTLVVSVIVAVLAASVAAHGLLRDPAGPAPTTATVGSPAADTAPASAPSAGRSNPQAQSGLEDLTGIQYQADAGIHGDAPDTCQAVDAARSMAPDAGEPLSAMLVEGDDHSDAFAVPIPLSYEGTRLRFELIPNLGETVHELSFDIVDAACGFSVFDPDAAIYHTGQTVPFEPTPGFQTHEFAPMPPDTCNPAEWKFHIKHLRGANPSHLYVEWSNGDEEYIAIDDADPSQVSKYTTRHNVENTLVRVAVSMPLGWAGEFTIPHGPCDLTAGELPKPSRGPLSGEFTVIEGGSYVLLVAIERGAVDTLTGGLAPMRCDEDICRSVYAQSSFKADLHTVAAS